jgi:hypothetical protein
MLPTKKEPRDIPRQFDVSFWPKAKFTPAGLWRWVCAVSYLVTRKFPHCRSHVRQGWRTITACDVCRHMPGDCVGHLLGDAAAINKMVRLIQSPAYRQLWGDRFSFTKTGERRLENNMTGFKLRLDRRARRTASSSTIPLGSCGHTVALTPHWS